MPLREGGSLPALTEADDDFKYVLKFRGSGHGSKVLIAELIGGEIARAVGLKVPELVFANLDEAFGRTEPDQEIQDLLQSSQGLNLALSFLSGAVTFDPVAIAIEEKLASKIVWLDAFITNVDRTIRNTNMLMFYRELWLIDHGACLYFHHSWSNWKEAAVTPFALIKDHVFIAKAKFIDEVNEAFLQLLTDEKLRTIVALIPDAWLNWENTNDTPDTIREIYFQFLKTRLANTAIFVNEIKNARKIFI